MDNSSVKNRDKDALSIGALLLLALVIPSAIMAIYAYQELVHVNSVLSKFMNEVSKALAEYDLDRYALLFALWSYCSLSKYVSRPLFDVAIASALGNETPTIFAKYNISKLFTICTEIHGTLSIYRLKTLVDTLFVLIVLGMATAVASAVYAVLCRRGVRSLLREIWSREDGKEI